MFRKCLLLVAVIIVLQTSFSTAHELMMTDITYVFLEKLNTTAKENYARMNSLEGRIKDSGTKEKVKLAKYDLDEYHLALETEVKKNTIFHTFGRLLI